MDLGLPAPDGDKERRFRAVARAVVDGLLHGEPGDLRYATVARRAGVSRAWLYKYFGDDPNALVDFAAKLFGDAFAALDPGMDADWRAAVLEGTRKALADVAEHPWVVLLYFRYRHDDGRLGRALADVRRRHVDALAAASGLDRATVDRLTGLRLGLYYDWADPAFRAQHRAEDVLALLARALG